MGDIELTSAELDELERLAKEGRACLVLRGYNTPTAALLRLISLARSGLEARKAEESMRERAAKLVEELTWWNGSEYYCDSCHNGYVFPDGEDVAKNIRALPLTEGGNKP